MLLDRLDNIVDRSGYVDGGFGADSRPADALKRNFWFCTIDDPSTIETRYRIGVENIMVETDYPHGDGTWPETQAVIEKLLGSHPGRRAAQDDAPQRRQALPSPAPEVTVRTRTGQVTARSASASGASDVVGCAGGHARQDEGDGAGARAGARRSPSGCCSPRATWGAMGGDQLSGIVGSLMRKNAEQAVERAWARTAPSRPRWRWSRSPRAASTRSTPRAGPRRPRSPTRSATGHTTSSRSRSPRGR